jgi:integrase
LTAIFKKIRVCPETGKPIQSTNYYLKHRFDGEVRPVEFSLRTSDKRVAQNLATEYVQSEERKRSGLYVTPQQRADGAKGLQEFVGEYIKYLVDKGTQRDHYRKVQQRLTDGIARLGWSSLGSINKKEYQGWIRARTDLSKKTQSHYQTAFKAFSKWLWEEDLLPENPFENVRGIKGIAASAPPPAALTVSEARKLLATSPGYRGDFYCLMLWTGLRAIEVNRLRVGSIRKEGGDTGSN